jgi:hypothetical protein
LGKYHQIQKATGRDACATLINTIKTDRLAVRGAVIPARRFHPVQDMPETSAFKSGGMDIEYVIIRHAQGKP